MNRLIAAACAATLLGAPALANIAPPHTVWEPAWDADVIDGDWALSFSESIVIACPEAKKQLRITIAPAWEVGYGRDDGTVFNGPTDKVTVKFGDASFEAVQDSAIKDQSVYVLPADADSVTAIMRATNAEIILASDPQQARKGLADDEGGSFDVFATTCAQINGLK